MEIYYYTLRTFVLLLLRFHYQFTSSWLSRTYLLCFFNGSLLALHFFHFWVKSTNKTIKEHLYTVQNYLAFAMNIFLSVNHTFFHPSAHVKMIFQFCNEINSTLISFHLWTKMKLLILLTMRICTAADDSNVAVNLI